MNVNHFKVEDRTKPISDLIDEIGLHRFHSKVNKGPIEECWEWMGTRIPSGYGQITLMGQVRRAHRVSYVLHYGHDHMEELVCHKCDNPKCVNPHHLFLSDNKGNQRDASRKGRSYMPVGELAPSNKLSSSQVQEIRRLATSTVQRRLAEQFGISFQQVSRIVNRTRWKHL